METNTIEHIIDELVLLGEDAEELKFWKSIFDDLTIEEQGKFRMNLENELKELKKLKKS